MKVTLFNATFLPGSHFSMGLPFQAEPQEETFIAITEELVLKEGSEDSHWGGYCNWRKEERSKEPEQFQWIWEPSENKPIGTVTVKESEEQASNYVAWDGEILRSLSLLGRGGGWEGCYLWWIELSFQTNKNLTKSFYF